MNKRVSGPVAIVIACVLLAPGCTGAARYKYEQPLNVIDDAYRTWYEVFVPSFEDSNGDGIGDLAYGTLGDLERLVTECHKRGMRLIIDYEMNHTLSQHPWFLSATSTLEHNPTHPAANPCLGYYNFVRGRPAVGNYAEVGTTDWYYEDEFSPSMPDLNLDNAGVRGQIQKSSRFWLEKGVDGFRLDGVLYYYGGNSSGDTDRNVTFVDWLVDYCRTIDSDVCIVGEVWSNASTIAEYRLSTMARNLE